MTHPAVKHLHQAHHHQRELREAMRAEAERIAAERNTQGFPIADEQTVTPPPDAGETGGGGETPQAPGA